ncbi:response regulator [Derxia lacustris]|uniref:response regulator n=1 Tax=Derxia lacustris TaxID=764842 RepID=UPI000A170FB4|nr:response regulator transcription factor [Derxia lacustris]
MNQRTASGLHRLLVIDDDERLVAMLRDYLAPNGFEITLAFDIAAGLAALGRERFDIVLLDLMLPDGNGLDVCRQLRAAAGAEADVGLVMLTARGESTDRVIGLELGADDYVTKPFDPRELLARLRAVLRRRQSAPADPQREVKVFGRLEIDRAGRCVRVDGETRSLTSHQFALLDAMAERAGRVLTRDQLMELVQPWHGEETFDRSIDVHIARIRAAIEDDARHPQRIVTVRGIGYVFSREQDSRAA